MFIFQEGTWALAFHRSDVDCAECGLTDPTKPCQNTEYPYFHVDVFGLIWEESKFIYLFTNIFSQGNLISNKTAVFH